MFLIVFFSSLLAALAAAPKPSFYAATSSSFLWQGRYFVPPGEEVVAFDVEGASMTFTIANASFVSLAVNDTTLGGARLGIYVTSGNTASSLSDPNPSGAQIPNLRTATLLSSKYQSEYILGSGSSLYGQTFTYSVVLLSEWEMISDYSLAQMLSIAGVTTDGIVLAPPPRPSRRLIILGDSLSSGVGCGFSIPSSGAPCGAGVLLDDVGATWGYSLC